LKQGNRNLILGLIGAAIIGIVITVLFSNEGITIENSKNFQAIETNYGTINFNTQQGNFSKGKQNLCERDEFNISFEIPNPFWLCLEYADYLTTLGREITDESILESLFLGRTTGESIVVVVRTNELLKNSSIQDHVYYLINEHENKINQSVEIKNLRIFGPDGPAHWELEHNDMNMESGKMYHINILWSDDQYVYTLEQSAAPPSLISDEIKNEIKQILESFRMI